MRKYLPSLIFIGLISIIIGYLIGSTYPLKGFFSNTDNTKDTANINDENIAAGKGKLEITVINSDNEPMVGIEIDVNYSPGEPPSWGVAEADTNGLGTFELDPGVYVIYFNELRFPSGYAMPDTKNVLITEGEKTRVTIILNKK